MYSITHLFSLQYWFGQAPFLGKPALLAMIIVFSLMLIAGAIVNAVANNKKSDKALSRGLKKIAKLLGTMGVLAFVLLFFRYEFVAIFSRRFMFALWFIGLVVWVIPSVKYFVKVVPKQQAEKMEQERLKKYLP